MVSTTGESGCGALQPSVEVLKAADAKNILLPRVEAIEALAEDGPWRGVRCC